MTHGYEHYTGRPVTPGVHEIAFVPQSIADGWQAFCSCGEWKEFCSTRGFTREKTQAVLWLYHAVHVRRSK